MLFEARGDGKEVLELVKEALDQLPEAPKMGTEKGHVDAPWYGFDRGPRAEIEEFMTESVAIVNAVGQQNLAGAAALEHVGGASSVVGWPSLSFRPNLFVVLPKGGRYYLEVGADGSPGAVLSKLRTTGCTSDQRITRTGFSRPRFAEIHVENAARC